MEGERFMLAVDVEDLLPKIEKLKAELSSLPTTRDQLSALILCVCIRPERDLETGLLTNFLDIELQSDTKHLH